MKLPPNIKERWTTALRSGQYEQGSCELRVGNTYCCLGVLAEVLEPGVTEGEGALFGCTNLSKEFCERHGLEALLKVNTDMNLRIFDDPKPIRNAQDALAVYNDRRGDGDELDHDFNDIATVIEEYL